MASVAEQFTQDQPTFEPVPLLPEMAKAAEYPINAMSDRMRKATVAIAKRAYVPVSLAGNSVLSAVSLAVQGHFDVVLPRGGPRPCSLFLVTVATTGERKSTADETAMTEVSEYQRELVERYRANENDHIAKKAAWAAAKTEAVNGAKKSGKDAIEAALIELGPEPDEPMRPMIMTRVGTTEGLLKQYESCRPSLGLMSDEGGSWLGGYSLSEDKRLATVATLSDLWDGKPVQRLTGGEGLTILYGRRLTFHMMIQPVLSARLLGDSEFKGQGFLSRLLVTHPDSLAGTRLVDIDEVEDPAVENDLMAFHDRIAQIIRSDPPMDPDSRALKPRSLHMTDQAKRMWWAFYNSLEARIGPEGDLEDVKGFVNKLPEQAARLAAVMACFEYGNNVREIDAQMLASGIELATFYLSEAVRLFGLSAPDPILADAALVSDWLRDKWKENLISTNHIKQFGPSAMRKRSADELREIVDTLIRNDHITVRLNEPGHINGKRVRNVHRVLIGR